MAIPAGLEPATLCLEGRCSIQLSYGTSFEIWAFYHGSILNQSAKTRTNSQIGQGSPEHVPKWLRGTFSLRLRRLGSAELPISPRGRSSSPAWVLVLAVSAQSSAPPASKVKLGQSADLDRRPRRAAHDRRSRAAARRAGALRPAASTCPGKMCAWSGEAAMADGHQAP